MCRATPKGVEQSNYSGFHTVALVSKHTQLRLQCRTHLNNVKKQRATWDGFIQFFCEGEKKKQHSPGTPDCATILQEHKQKKGKLAFVVARVNLISVWLCILELRKQFGSSAVAAAVAASPCAAATLGVRRSGEIWK